MTGSGRVHGTRHLEHLRDLLTAAGHDAPEATLGLFSTNGFTEVLVGESSTRPVLVIRRRNG
jgi:hypothetical protein